MSASRTDGGTAAIIGIDLGTTNTAVAVVEGRGGVRPFDVPQLVAPREIDRRRVLPSFVYFPTAAEANAGALVIPWSDSPSSPSTIVGEHARDHGALTPARQVASAKSWLANPAVDRTAPILPWAVEEGPRISPVTASTRILQHLRDAWNADRAGGDPSRRLERQRIVLTVPASFDEEARELTAQAAREAGLVDFKLLEEPLAALYAWIAGHRRVVGEHLAGGETVLVCDVGGGTTDFTLIRVEAEDGDLRFERTAIGEHLLLGGDNLDLALAALVEQKLAADASTRLGLMQRLTLRRKCSAAKERLLSTEDDRVAITLLGTGRSVVAGGMSADLTRGEVIDTLVRGFLPLTDAGERPSRERRAGLRELGLPYETDPAITRHLAAFLDRAARAAGAEDMARPDVVLFNGGFFTPSIARERVLDALEAWFGRRPRMLANARPEIAVAAGAAFYGRVRRDPQGLRRFLVRAGSARSYYVGVASSDAAAGPAGSSGLALCVMPRGTQEGSSLAIDRDFTVLTNRPLAFNLYSTTQRADELNALVSFADEDEAHTHAPLVTSLRFGKRSRQVPIQVRLTADFTETGTLELWCRSTTTEHRWRLAFNLRRAEEELLPEEADESAAGSPAAAGPAAGEDASVVVEAEAIETAGRLAREVFEARDGSLGPEGLTAELERVLGHGKHAWPIGVLRALADSLLAVEPARRRSPAFESRWLNLVGFCARPGFGTPLDAWRISELRKVYAAGLAFPKDIQTQVEWLVLWQRVAAGFSTGQQRELGQRVAAQLGAGQRKPPRINPQIEREGWRLLGALERLDRTVRAKLGDELLVRIARDPRNAAMLWAFGRLGARTPVYGPLSSVVSPAVAERWIERLLDLRTFNEDAAAAVVQLGGLTGDDARDVNGDIRRRAEARVAAAGYPREASALITIRPMDRASTERAFGEPMPEGLRLDTVAPPA